MVFAGVGFWFRIVNVGLCLVGEKIGKKLNFFKFSFFDAVLGFGKKREVTESELYYDKLSEGFGSLMSQL